MDLLALMTPEQWTAALPGVALIVTAIGSLLAAIIGAVSLFRQGREREAARGSRAVVEEIQRTTNGAASHQREIKETLQRELTETRAELAEVIAAAREAAENARRAAADVRAERTAPSPMEPGGDR